jgi:hypothetical protein
MMQSRHHILLRLRLSLGRAKKAQGCCDTRFLLKTSAFVIFVPSLQMLFVIVRHYSCWRRKGGLGSPEAEEEAEEMANTMPKSADLRRVKPKFEEIDLRIPGYMSLWRECSAARELFCFAINGLDYQGDAKRIDRLAQLELPFLQQ